MVEDAIQFAQKYDIDGYRVDAVKHIPYAVHHNFQQRVEEEFEYRNVGGKFEFYTIGETFSGERDLLNSYIGPSMLDGQFDFSLYWSLLSSMARYESPLYELENTYIESKAVYGDSLMGNFLGNHDVERFISHAAGEVSNLYGDGDCPDGYWRPTAEAPDYSTPYQRLKLAWSWLLTHNDLALIYYGDEIGLPGYHDPDNRQKMLFDDELSAYQQDVLDHLRKLGSIRRDFPELLDGEISIWWGEPDPDVLGIARTSSYGSSLAVFNRSETQREISNGLGWANLPTNGRYLDKLTGEYHYPNGDSLSLSIPPLSSIILIWEE
jgi:glycosidase